MESDRAKDLWSGRRFSHCAKQWKICDCRWIFFCLFKKSLSNLATWLILRCSTGFMSNLKKEGSVLLDACKVRLYVTSYNFCFHRQVEGTRCTSNVLFSNMKSIKAEFFKKIVNIPYEQSFALHAKKRKKKEEKEINNSHNKLLNFSLQSFVVLNTWKWTDHSQKSS